MSERSLVQYLDKNPLIIPDRDSDKFALLLSDSQGKCLQKLHSNSKLPVQFLCTPGARTQSAFEKAKAELERILSDQNKPVVVYVWLGTCDITEKISHRKGWIDVRYATEGEATRKIIKQYHKLQEFVFSKQGTVKFITIPTYSSVLYNKNKNHKQPDKFERSDKKISSEVNKLNEQIIELNNSLGRNTLQFHRDIIKNRPNKNKNKPSRETVNWHLLKDGLHPNKVLARKWLRRLELDIVSECWSDPDFVSLRVDPQEAQSTDL